MDKQIVIKFDEEEIEVSCTRVTIEEIEQAIVTLTELYEQVEKYEEVN